MMRVLSFHYGNAIMAYTPYGYVNYPRGYYIPCLTYPWGYGYHCDQYTPGGIQT